MLKTKEQRRRDIKRHFLLKKKEDEKLKKNEEKRLSEKPAFIKTLSQRLKRLNPFDGVASLDYLDCAHITYYKLRQFGFDDVKILITTNHAWCEIKYNDEWWIFDPIAVRKLDYGEPLKRKKTTKIDVYTDFARTFTDVDSFEYVYNDRLTYDNDEAKIEAMKDSGLSSVLRFKYI